MGIVGGVAERLACRTYSLQPTAYSLVFSMALFKKALDKFAAGLSRTRAMLAGSIKSLLTIGRKIDEDLLEELEQQLIEADIGVAAAMHICDDLRRPTATNASLRPNR